MEYGLESGRNRIRVQNKEWKVHGQMADHEYFNNCSAMCIAICGFGMIFKLVTSFSILLHRLETPMVSVLFV